MNPFLRLRRYVAAWAAIGQIQRKTNATPLEELVDDVFNIAHGFFAPIQIREEILDLLRELQVRRPRVVLEIGTAAGGTLLLWSRIAHPDALLITVDLPGGDFGGGSSYLRVPLIRRLSLPTQSLHVLRANSHDTRTLDATRKLLAGRKVDFLFIDADHTEDGVRSDFAMYGSLLEEGGLVAFHDIALREPPYGVHKLWTELRQSHRTREILGQPTAYGLGVLYK